MSSHLLLILLGGLITAPALLHKTATDVDHATRSYLRDYEPPAPEDGELVEVSILRLKNAKYSPGRPLPKWVADLDGKRVRIWGYMAIGTLEGLKKFELVPESCECGKSRVNHFVDVTLTEGQTRFIPGRIWLEGTFHASEIEEDGFITSLYRLSTQELPR